MRSGCCLAAGAVVLACLAALLGISTAWPWGVLFEYIFARTAAAGVLAPTTIGTLAPRLVREEDLRPADKEDALEKLGRLPTLVAPAGGVDPPGVDRGAGFTTQLSSWMSAWLRIDELRRDLQYPGGWRGNRDLAPTEESAGTGPQEDSDAGARPVMPSPPILAEPITVDELRKLVRRSLLFVAVALKAAGGLLLVIVPMTCFAYGVLDFLYLEQRVLLPQRLLGFLMRPLDRLLRPLLVTTARVFGLDQTEVLCERGDSPEGSKCAKRVLLGLMVLNVLASGLAMLALAVLVFLVRALGILA